MKTTRRIGSLALLLAGAAMLPGCLLFGAVAVGAGVVAATSEDTAQVDLRADPAAVYQAGVSRLESEGNVTATDEANRTVKGKIDGSKVTISVFKVNEFTRVRVEARKLGAMLPDLDLAKQIATDISHSF